MEGSLTEGDFSIHHTHLKVQQVIDKKRIFSINLL
jgi:hypothetical protein